MCVTRLCRFGGSWAAALPGGLIKTLQQHGVYGHGAAEVTHPPIPRETSTMALALNTVGLDSTAVCCL